MAYPKAAGTRMCVARSAITSTGYVLATSGGVTAWVDVTTHRTVTGGSTVEARGHVRAAKALAARYGVVLQFAYRDDLGRTGNIRSAAPWLSGTYSGITGKPAAGRGLVRLGTGGVDLSRISLATRSQRRALVMNTVRHELGHALGALLGLDDEALGDLVAVSLERVEPETHPVREAFAEAVGCGASADVPACLRQRDPETLLRAWTGGAFAVGGAALPRQPGDALATGTANRVDLMHGNTLDENRLFIPLQYGTTLTAAQYTAAIRARFGTAADAVLARYPVESYGSPIIALSTVFSDYGTALSTCSHVDAYEVTSDRRGARVFAYQFQDRTADPLVPILGTQNGASHATELPFLFPGLFGDGLSAEQEALSDAMVAYWTSFAARGRPSGRGLPRWPQYERPGDVMALDLPAAGGIGVEDVAAAARCGFWSQLG